MATRAAFVADGQAAELVQPGQRALHHPTMPSQALAGRAPFAGKPTGDAAAPQVVPTPLGGVGLVRVPLGRGFRGRPNGRLIGAIASTIVSNSVPSFTFAAERRMASGMPGAATTPWRFVPGWPRSVGLRPVASPPRSPGPWHCPDSPATSRSGPARPSGRAAPGAADAIPQLAASRAAGASRSSRSRSPARAATSPTECPCGGRTGCP